jgi:gliding-associated putative ABC transporter substrate-binding component GldG
MDWPFFPLINQYADHPITRNLDAVVARFVSSIDTVKAEGVRKTPLLFSSLYARSVTAPVPVNINDLRNNVSAESFSKSFIPVGYLLEGNFTSVFKNRFLPEGEQQAEFRDRSVSTKVIVFADGDLVRNDVNPRTGQAQPLGFDQFTRYTFANQELLLNAVAYLVNDEGLIATRNKEVKIRLLDKQKIKNERTQWQLINLVLPVVLIVLYGIFRAILRKRTYATF